MFKSTQFSDVTVVIRTVAQDDSSNNSDAANTTSSIATADGPAASKIDVDQAPDKSDGIELADFPGHQIILCQSDYFRAQVSCSQAPYRPHSGQLNKYNMQRNPLP